MSRERIELSHRAYSDMRETHSADDRAWKILDLICAEWQSDPMSVQCFDLRLVAEAIALVAKRKKMRDPFNPFTTAKERSWATGIAQDRYDRNGTVIRDPEPTDAEAIARFVEIAESQRKGRGEG